MSTTRTPIELRARQQFTTAGEQSGALSRALAAELTEDLAQAYLDCVHSPDWANPVFGGTARRWQAAIGAELIRRGITSITVTDCFGIRKVQVKGAA